MGCSHDSFSVIEHKPQEVRSAQCGAMERQSKNGVGVMFPDLVCLCLQLFGMSWRVNEDVWHLCKGKSFSWNVFSAYLQKGLEEQNYEIKDTKGGYWRTNKSAHVLKKRRQTKEHHPGKK